MRTIAITWTALLVLAVQGAGAAAPVRVALAAQPAALTVGRAWTASLRVTPRTFSGDVRVTASGPGKLAVRATGRHGAYRARLVFPTAGRWTLTARAGASTSPLGSVTVAAPAPTPLALAWPTSIDLQPDGSLLVVENGAGVVERVQPASGHVTVLASGLAKPYAAAAAPGGAIYVSNGALLERIDGASAPVAVATADTDIGPVAVAPDGAVYYATATQVLELHGGPPRPVASGLSNPHGLAVASDGTLVVCDTDADRVLRIDPPSGATTTLIHTARPRGIDIAGDASIYLVEGAAKRVGRYDASGTRRGDVGPGLQRPVRRRGRRRRNRLRARYRRRGNDPPRGDRRNGVDRAYRLGAARAPRRSPGAVRARSLHGDDELCPLAA